MKKTLEQALAEAKPEQNYTDKWESFDAFLRYYLDDTRYQECQIKRLSALAHKPASSVQLNNHWDSIPFLIGILYRSMVDGHRPLEIIGMTREQENSFSSICSTIRNSISAYNSGGSGSKNTVTKSLYDQIRSIGF